MPVVEMRDEFLLKIETGETITWGEYKRRHPAPQAQPDARAVEGVKNAWDRLSRDLPDSLHDGLSHLIEPFEAALQALSAPAADDGWRDPKTLPHPAVAGCFFAAIRVSEHGGPLKWQVHLIALDDETHDVHLNYDHGWTWADYELWKPCVWPAAPTGDS